jgi:hypothetical protein
VTDSSRKDADDADDDLGLDESMSSMRSMFREMRDEEPSDKGLAALLSAAREKAEEMKPKRSWWGVLLEQLRRPPVLAMATVVVLIGGAVVISGREDMKAETETVSTTPSRMYVADQLDPAAPGAARDDGYEEGAASARSTGAAAGSATNNFDAPPPTTPPVVQRPPRATTKPGRTRGPVAEKAKPADGLAIETKPAPEPTVEAKKEDEKAPMAIAADEDMQVKGGSTVTESTSSNAPQTDSKSVSRKPLPSIEGEDRAARDASIAQLLKQCEAAAAKNDCAAVRTIAAKIAKQDPQAYKNRVLKSSSISRCLAPPAPVEAAPEAAN